MRKQLKQIIKTIFCMLSGVVSVQHNFGKIKRWVDIEPETADYYSCFLFRNGRHIPVPIMFSIYGITITRIGGKICWTKFNPQEIIIFILSKMMKLRQIRKWLDKMDQETIILANSLMG